MKREKVGTLRDFVNQFDIEAPPRATGDHLKDLIMGSKHARRLYWQEVHCIPKDMLQFEEAFSGQETSEVFQFDSYTVYIAHFRC